MNTAIEKLKTICKSDPAWSWLIATISTFFILPEYISPFILFTAFIVFKRQWSKENKKARLGTLGKIELCLMGYMLLSTLWSDTKLDTLGMSGLWFGMLLVQVMIYNLARTKERVDTILKTVVFGASVNGLVASVQIVTYLLFKENLISQKFVLVTPFYKTLDKIVYSSLPFEISTKTFDDRACGFFSNPNLLASLLVASLPIAIYLLINAKSAKNKTIYYFANILITCGISATMSRTGCVIALAGWVLAFILLVKRSSKELISVGIPAFALLIASVLTRYGVIFKPEVIPTVPTGLVGNLEAKQSSAVHFEIWESLLDYLFNNPMVFLFGSGFGCEGTGTILNTFYDLNKPHAHNFIIEIWVEIGLVGLIALLSVIIIAIKKLLEINADTKKKYSLLVCATTSLIVFLGFGITDYIFGSPKQIFIFLMLIGIIQAIYYSYNGENVTTLSGFKKNIKRNYKNAIK